MNPEEKLNLIASIVKSKKGKWISISFEKKGLESAAFRKQGITVRKVTTVIGRVGINYQHLKTIKELGIKGLYTPKPTWYVHTKFPGIVEHKTHLEQKYLQIFTNNNNACRPKVQYYRDDTPITKEEAKSLCPASAFSSNPELVYVVSVDNLLEINKQNLKEEGKNQ